MVADLYTEADLDYIRANYLTLHQLCAERAESSDEVETSIARGLLPRPSYVLADGTAMFPSDYFRLADEAGGAEALKQHFAARHRAACLAYGADVAALEEDWAAYMDGIYGICLREVTPETIVRKGLLVASICQLLVLASPSDAGWRDALRAHVAELDTLEREFAPNYDRRPDKPLPTRDLLIEAPRTRYPEIFALSAGMSHRDA